MVKIVVKKEGATQNCGRCGSDLICRVKDYGGNFAPTLQWQNYDGTAHYKTTDGKKFSCNIPDEDENAQTRIPSESPTTSGNPPPKPATYVDAVIREGIENINLRLEKIDEMVQAIFRYTVDEQLKKK